MSEVTLVRASRDGDQFHYVWAARRCLALLSPGSPLKAITIEGPSALETDADNALPDGDELIDVGEYYGSERLEEADLVRYIQVKHSTLRIGKPFAPSELEKTLKGFADRYKGLLKHLQTDDLSGKIEFWFVSNRKPSPTFLRYLSDIAERGRTSSAKNLAKLEQFTSLSGDELSAFCKLLRMDKHQDGLWDQENLLTQDAGSYLADSDADAHAQLKELVVKKALSRSASNPSITRTDVLRALRTDESRLFPAPCLIRSVENTIQREQEHDLLQTIMAAGTTPVIVHAAGGVGKSVFATRIRHALPNGSWSVLYDCFGNGQYRSATGYRHRHKDALVQIANELATQGLCHPLIPTPHADSAAYVRAFIHRLAQSIQSLRSKDPDAILCIIIDAADNAQMAAEEIGETRSFVRDLIREHIPEGVRLVMLCRTHRQSYLDPPHGITRLELRPFTRSETAQYLRRTFPAASDRDIDELHRLSSQNPRVQALALAQTGTLGKILRGLGPNPKSVEDMICGLLEDSVARLRDSTGAIERVQIDRICTGLAALRPLVPISVLASISEVEEAAVRSFAFDLGRPLLVTGNAVQFLDEPTETWFKEKFKPKAHELRAFVETLKPLAAESAYVASALPQIMLEAGHLSELVELALSSEALPNTSPVERRDAELQRLHFALKASLRTRRYVDATKLSLKSGGESAGNERQRKLLQANTDLAGILMEDERVQELISRRIFGSGWTGSHNAYEAALLSAQKDLLGDARSRLRMAFEWLDSWSRLPEEDRRMEKIEDSDIVELLTASFNIHGAKHCAADIRRWQPRELSFRVGRILAARFVDHGRYEDLDALAVAAGNDLPLVLGITRELRKVHRVPPSNVVKRALRLAANGRIQLEDSNRWNSEGSALAAVTCLVEAACRLGVGTTRTYIALLSRYLPDSPRRGLSSRYSDTRFIELRAYALLAALKEEPLAAIDLAHHELREELESSKSYSQSQEVREFRETIEVLLPWHNMWAEAFVGRRASSDLAQAIAEARTASQKADINTYGERSYTSDEIARIWFDMLVGANVHDQSFMGVFDDWAANLKHPLSTATLTGLARVAARCGRQAKALKYADEAFQQSRAVREDAEAKADGYIRLSRSVLTISEAEAITYFDQAVDVSSKIGDENLERWSALLDLSNQASSADKHHTHTAYRLARCAELTYDYVARDKHFDWEATVEAICGLCARSSLAILSRWRDRGFGWWTRLLPVAVSYLLEQRSLDPKVALALLPLRAEWSEPDLLEHALATTSSKDDLEAAVALSLRYFSLDKHTASKWRKMKAVLTKHDVRASGTDARIAYYENEETSKKQTDGYQSADYSLPNDDRQKDWDSIFKGVNLLDASDILLAHRRFKGSEPPYYDAAFFEEACRRVPPGKEPEFITSVRSVSNFDLYTLRNLFDHIPDDWQSRLAVKRAIAEVLRSICRQYCTDIRKYRYYEAFPLKSACEIAGIPEAEAIDVVLTALAERTEDFRSERLFSLVGLIAQKLSKDEAIHAIEFGLDLLEPILEESDGDGPWDQRFEPPSDLEDAVAGYIWACLGAPQSGLRWEAAHVVRSLVSLDCKRTLGSLVAFASASPSEAFHDRHLEFYGLHARQWLLIGLARAARDHPHRVASHSDFLMQAAFEGEPHVLIREFSRRALECIAEADLLEHRSELTARLRGINTSQLPAVDSRSYDRRDMHPGELDAEEDVADQEDRFVFGIDVGPYWYAPLGRRFSVSQQYVEREALRVIKNEWRVQIQSKWDADERHRRKIFRERETYHSHGTYPRTDEWRFYLAYHAMMVVAGKLLKTLPVHRDPDDPVDSFKEWLSGHDLARQDLGWLSDRRDPVPMYRPAWKDETASDQWRESVSDEDYKGVLLEESDRLNLWGHWSWVEGRRKESVHVQSALVCADRSSALLRALACVHDPNDYCIPAVDDDREIDTEEFQLKGWVARRSSEGGIDERDPWAGDIPYPPPAPAPHIVEMMNLGRDHEGREWHTRGDNCSAIWTEVWGSVGDEERESFQEGGRRLRASYSFIISMLRAIQMDLIVKIGIERTRTYARWENDSDDGTEHNPGHARIFLIRSDGRIVER